MKVPKVIIESHIPFVDNYLDDVAEVVRLNPENITGESIADADALIVRTRTHCNSQLLKGSKIRFIATATIGTDHIDFNYCNKHGIEVVSAPGCNAPAVAQYVWTSIFKALHHLPQDATIAVVGAGHVGSIVAQWGKTMGYNILCCDPPRALKEGMEKFTSLENIARNADVITFHTPHTVNGEYATHHMAGENFFNSLKQKPLVINAARGPIVDTPTIVNALECGKISGACIDCWENEPHVNLPLLKESVIATPHIAGYSLQGKQRATAMVLKAFMAFISSNYVHLAHKTRSICENIYQPPMMPAEVQTNLKNKIIESYNPLEDTAKLKLLLQMPHSECGAYFEHLRNKYHYRQEVGFSE